MTLLLGPIPKAAEQRQMNALKQGLGLGAPKVHCWKLSCISNDLGKNDVSWFFWDLFPKGARETFEFQENLVKIFFFEKHVTTEISFAHWILSTEADWKWHCAPHAGLIRWISDVMSRTVFCFRIEKSHPLTEDFRKKLDVER